MIGAVHVYQRVMSYRRAAELAPAATVENPNPTQVWAVELECGHAAAAETFSDITARTQLPTSMPCLECRGLALAPLRAQAATRPVAPV